MRKLLFSILSLTLIWSCNKEEMDIDGVQPKLHNVVFSIPNFETNITPMSKLGQNDWSRLRTYMLQVYDNTGVLKDYKEVRNTYDSALRVEFKLPEGHYTGVFIGFNDFTDSINIQNQNLFASYINTFYNGVSIATQTSTIDKNISILYKDSELMNLNSVVGVNNLIWTSPFCGDCIKNNSVLDLKKLFETNGPGSIISFVGKSMQDTSKIVARITMTIVENPFDYEVVNKKITFFYDDMPDIVNLNALVGISSKLNWVSPGYDSCINGSVLDMRKLQPGSSLTIEGITESGFIKASLEIIIKLKSEQEVVNKRLSVIYGEGHSMFLEDVFGLTMPMIWSATGYENCVITDLSSNYTIIYLQRLFELTRPGSVVKIEGRLLSDTSVVVANLYLDIVANTDQIANPYHNDYFMNKFDFYVNGDINDNIELNRVTGRVNLVIKDINKVMNLDFQFVEIECQNLAYGIKFSDSANYSKSHTIKLAKSEFASKLNLNAMPSSNVKLTIKLINNGIVTRVFNNLPTFDLHKNYITNVRGNLLSPEAGFDISFNDSWNGEEDIDF